jgi:hypothetical protein
MIPKNGIHRIINLACDTTPSNSSSGKPDIRVFEITGSQYTRIKQTPVYKRTNQNSKLMSESDCPLSLLAAISEKKMAPILAGNTKKSEAKERAMLNWATRAGLWKLMAKMVTMEASGGAERPTARSNTRFASAGLIPIPPPQNQNP